MNVRSGGNALRRRRMAAEMTIEDVLKGLESRGIKMETSDISRLENGRVTSPSLEKVTIYGTFLGLSPNEIAQAYELWVPPKS